MNVGGESAATLQRVAVFLTLIVRDKLLATHGWRSGEKLN